MSIQSLFNSKSPLIRVLGQHYILLQAMNGALILHAGQSVLINMNKSQGIGRIRKIALLTLPLVEQIIHF